MTLEDRVPNLKRNQEQQRKYFLPVMLFVEKAHEVHWLRINELHGENFTRRNRQRSETCAG
jgi:hypothetical protein